MIRFKAFISEDISKLEEGYKIKLERDSNMYVLNITDTKTGNRTEVRGKGGYESSGYDSKDKLHKLLDEIGRSANVSELINGSVVTINPKHPKAVPAKKALVKAFNESAELNEDISSISEGRDAPLYHGTEFDSLLNILKTNTIRGETEHENLDGKRLVGISTTRDFRFAASWTNESNSPVIELNQPKIVHNYKIKPISYNSSHREEAEDFIVAKGGLKPANRYIVRIILDDEMIEDPTNPGWTGDLYQLQKLTNKLKIKLVNKRGKVLKDLQ